MKLSTQGKMTFVMVLQKALMEGKDISHIMSELEFELDGGELVCVNPPVIELGVCNTDDSGFLPPEALNASE
jgi:hypothetical protein